MRKKMRKVNYVCAGKVSRKVAESYLFHGGEKKRRRDDVCF